MPLSVLVGMCVCRGLFQRVQQCGREFRRGSAEALLGTLMLAALLSVVACGKGGNGGSGGDPGPAFHAIAIVPSPLPMSPVSLGVQLMLLQADCYPGSTVQIYGTDTYFPSGGTASTTNATNMQWSSSATSVATVSGGVVACISPGTAQITGSIPSENCDVNGTPCQTAPLTVSVGSAKHTLTLSPSSVTLNSGQSQQMTVSLVTETGPGVSTTQDVTAAVFSIPGEPDLAVVGAGNNFPIDFNASQNGNLVAQGSASAIMSVHYASGTPGFDYMSNLVLFTSK
jgi:hypothetical protein